MLELEGKIVCAMDVLEALRSDPDCPERTKKLVRKYLEKALRKVPYHHHQVTANELACLFPNGTRIHVRMKYASEEFTEKHWEENCGPWGDGTYYGITRYPVGECTVKSGSLFIPSRFGIKSRYDVTFTVYEPMYSEKMRKRWAMGL